MNEILITLADGTQYVANISTEDIIINAALVVSFVALFVLGAYLKGREGK